MSESVLYKILLVDNVRAKFLTESTLVACVFDRTYTSNYIL